MELSEYAAILRKRWVTVALTMITTIAISAAVTLGATPEYTASARVYFSAQAGDSVSDLYQGSTYAEGQMASYAEVATSPLVLDPVREDLGLTIDAHELANSIQVMVTPETSILRIAVTTEDPAVAADIANAVASQLSQTTAELSPDRPDGSEAVRATVLSSAVAPESPSSPTPTRNLTIGLVLGLMLGVSLALVRELLDTKVRGERDVQAVTDRAVIGTIAFTEAANRQPIFMEEDSMGAPAEAIRRLRTNLQFLDLAEGASSIVVTSSVAGEGKSTTAINLAVALAKSGARVALVDADLRRPSVADYLGLEGGVGLTTVLIGRAELADVVQPWRDSNLHVLPSGQVPPNPSELLGSRAMSTLLDQLTQAYDVVLIDSPPLLPVTDAAVLSKLAGGAIVVAGADRIHKAQLRESLDNLQNVNARVLGIVLNKVEGKAREGYYDSYRPEVPVAPESRKSHNARRSTWPGKPLASLRR